MSGRPGRRGGRFALALAAVLGVAAPAAAGEPFADFSGKLEGLVRLARPHLVQVIREVPGAQGKTRMIGTGIAFEKEHVLTSAGVVGSAAQVLVRVGNAAPVASRVVGVDRRTNVAVIEVSHLSIDPLPVAEDALLFPGDMVVAVALGSPEGPEASFGTTVLVDGPNLGMSDVEMVQVTAPAFPGMSGGILLNPAGEMVGMVSGWMDIDPSQAILPEGTSMVSGFLRQGRMVTTDVRSATLALPIVATLDIARELLVNGRVERGYLGVQVELVQIGAQKSKPFPGVMIHRLVPDAPADQAGLIPGDVILKYSQASVTSPEDLSFLVAATRPGARIPVLYLRRGTRGLVMVDIAQAPELPWAPEMDTLISGDRAEAPLAPLAH